MNVAHVDGSAFVWSKIEAVSIDPENRHFSMSQGFLLDVTSNTIVRYFGRAPHLCVWRDIRVLGKSCFAATDYVETLVFETDSKLVRIDDTCFQECSLRSICIHASVEALGRGCFSESRIETVQFEP
jgi:hypothetical protein